MSDQLHTLIQSLSQTEKRYFKLHASFAFENDNKLYIRLFDLILNQSEYNESAVKKQFNHIYFHQVKRQLFLKLLESLRAYHRNDSASLLIDHYLGDFRILLQKSLIPSAKKSLLKAMSLAKEHELFNEIIRIAQMETQLHVATGNPDAIKNHVLTIRKELPRLLKIIDNQLEIEQSYLLLIKTNKEIEFIRSGAELLSLQQIINWEQLLKSEALSTRSAVQLNYIKGLYAFLLGRFSESFAHFENQLKMLSEKPSIIEENKAEYTKALANTTLISIHLSKKQKFKHYFDRLSACHSIEKSDQSSLDYWKYLLELKQHVKQDEIVFALKLISENNRHISRLESEFESNNTYTTERYYVLFDTIWIHILQKNHQMAAKILFAFLNTTNSSVKTDGYILAKIIFMFIHVELNNIELVLSELQSLKRFLKERKRLFHFEKTCIRTLTQLVKVNFANEKKSIWIQFYNELIEMDKEPFERNTSFYFDLKKWVRQQIN